MKTPLLAGTTLLALFAAACNKPAEQPATETNITEPAKPAPPPPPPKPAPVAEVPKPEVPKAPPPPEVPADQQVLDDADATGMTARVDRNTDTPANSADGQ